MEDVIASMVNTHRIMVEDVKDLGQEHGDPGVVGGDGKVQCAETIGVLMDDRRALVKGKYLSSRKQCKIIIF